MGGRSSSSGMNRDGSAQFSFGGSNYNLSSQEVQNQAMKYMDWLDRDTARMHALGVVDGHKGYTDDEMLNGGSLAWMTTRNTLQRVVNNQNPKNKSRVEIKDVVSQLSPGQKNALVGDIKSGIRKWYEKDSSTKAGAAKYKKMRKSYNPETGTYRSI